MEVPNPEQTASVFSLAVYTFLDKIIWDAYKVPHLSHDKLPPLCDYDYSAKLTAESFPVSPTEGYFERALLMLYPPVSWPIPWGE